MSSSLCFKVTHFLQDMEQLWAKAVALGLQSFIVGSNLFSSFQASRRWMGFLLAPGCAHVAETGYLGFSVPLCLLSLPRTYIKSVSVGFWKAAVDCGLYHCIYAVGCPDVPPQPVLGLHGQLTSLSPEETCMLNFKPGVIKIAQQFGRRGDDRSCNWQQAQPHTTWMWKNRLGFESGVAEARHTFSAAEKLATS